MHRGQVLVAVTEVVLTELACGVAEILQELRDGRVLGGQPLLGTRHPDLGQTGADGLLAGDGLTPDTVEAARAHVEDLVKAVGRQPNEDEKHLIGSHPASGSAAAPAQQALPSTSSSTRGTEFPEIVAKWRTAELAVLDWLNSRGWQLTDVSKQNLGYDLVGLTPDGDRAMIEIKRVQRPDVQFAMTNNEMGAMQSEAGRYLLGIVVGEGRYSRFMLLDPTDKAVPRERVCRAWEWQFIDWSRHGTYVT